jgi:D-3-phosphoglycerate dehydrogenase / 2-oxoglutarate reductase
MADNPLPKIVITDGAADYPAVAMEALASSGVPFAVADTAGGSAALDAIRDGEVLLVTWYPVTSDVIAQLRRARVVIRIGVGYDNIDAEAARRSGIAVCNVPDYCQGEVADHALALALAQARCLPFLDRCVRDSVWKPALPHPMPAFEAMRFGVLGYGRIGRLAIARARAFGFQLLACDPYVPEGDFPPDVRRCTLDNLLAEADILSLHVPLTEETRCLLSAEWLGRMKPTAILVNTARGRVVDTVALADALQAGRLAAAGIDVFEDEPLPLDHPLLACPNALLTPHYAWHSRESRPKLYLMAVEEALRSVRDEPLRNCVVPVGGGRD